MEIFLLVIILGFIILIVRRLTDTKNELKELKNDFSKFQKQITGISSLTTEKAVEKPPVVKVPEPPAPKPETKIIDWPLTEKSIPEKQSGGETIRHEPVNTGAKVTGPSNIPSSAPLLKKGWFEKWLHDNPDIEKFIGENLINKIGIAVLVLGIAFFVKYAIDQEWINQIGRVCIGLLCGVILLWFANRLRKNYHAFSSVLVGGGITIFYFTIAFAFHQYHLISQSAAFGVMVIITVFAVLISILYDRLELGILATVGGFITPFLVSTGDGNWLILFSYITILNTGLIILAYYKRWRVINFIAFFFTEIIYLGWILSRYTGQTNFPLQGIFIFGTVFYLMFVVMNVIHHVVRGSKLKAFDFVILLSVNLAFYGAGIYLLEEGGESNYNGLFTASLGIVNLLLAYLFLRKSKADKKFIYLLIGITLSFISLAAPVQLRGHYITLFWSAEMVVLLWIYQKSFIRLLKVSLLFVSILMFISLLMDWYQLYAEDHAIYSVIFNKGWITGIFSSVSLYFVWRLLRSEADSFFVWGIPTHLIRNIYMAGSVLVFYFSGALEINDQFTHRFNGTGLQFIYLQLFLVVFILFIWNGSQRLRITVNKYLFLSFPLLVLVMYVLNINNVYKVETRILVKGEFREYFLSSWLSALFTLILIWQVIGFIRKNNASLNWFLPQITCIIAISTLILFSAETRNLFIWLNYSGPNSIMHAEANFNKAGLTIVWGVSSFIMIWLGMSHRYKPLRIIALVVFGITLLKLFMFDISNIAPAGKIIAFILLGVLLLIISFMYQRLKKIIIDDPKDKN